MLASVRLQSKQNGEINKFLSSFYNTDLEIGNKLKWEKSYANPIEIAEIIGVFADNFEKFNIKMWISLDKDIYIKISNNNANFIIKYLYERYPY